MEFVCKLVTRFSIFFQFVTQFCFFTSLLLCLTFFPILSLVNSFIAISNLNYYFSFKMSFSFFKLKNKIPIVGGIEGEAWWLWGREKEVLFLFFL